MKNFKRSLIATLLTSALALTALNSQAQGQVWEGQQSHSTNSSNGVDQSSSVFMLLIKSFLNSDISQNIRNGKHGVTYRSLVAQNVFLLEYDDPCYYLDNSGKVIRNQDQIQAPSDAYDISRSNNRDLIFEENNMGTRVSIYLALANLATDNFSKISQEKMTTAQVEQFLTKKINSDFVLYQKRVIDEKKDQPNIKVYFSSENGQEIAPGASGCTNNGFTAGTGTSQKSVRGPASKWKVYLDEYQMNFDGAHISIAKNGIDWISASAINGKDLKLSDSAKRESSNSRSKTKNQIQ